MQYHTKINVIEYYVLAIEKCGASTWPSKVRRNMPEAILVTTLGAHAACWFEVKAY